MGMSDGEPRRVSGSLIGVRAAWTCVVCHAKATTYQLVDAANPTLDLPDGWTQRKGRIYCPDAAAADSLMIQILLRERCL